MVEELIVAAVFAAIAVIVLVVGDRLRPQAWRHAGEEEPAGSLVFDLINTLFMAVVAFVVVICWQNHDNAHGDTVTEADALMNTYWTAHAMPEPEHHRIQALVRDYTNQVVNQEWSVMRHEHHVSQSAADTLGEVRDAVASVHSQDEDLTDLRNDALSSLEKVVDARYNRADATSHGIPGFLYGVLWFATILVLVNPVLSGIRVTRRSIVMIALFGVVVGSALLQVYNLDHPFSGAYMVSNDPFQQALSRYQHIT